MQRSYLFHASGLDNPFPVGRKDLGDSSYTSLVTAVVKVAWHHSMLDPENPLSDEKFSEISYTSQVIADFVPNFVDMATEVMRG